MIPDKSIGWHIAYEPQTSHGENKPITTGCVLRMEGAQQLIMCENGYHWSRELLDAMRHNGGSVVSLVREIMPTWRAEDKNVSYGREHIVVVPVETSRAVFCKFFSELLLELTEKRAPKLSATVRLCATPDQDDKLGFDIRDQIEQNIKDVPVGFPLGLGDGGLLYILVKLKRYRCGGEDSKFVWPSHIFEPLIAYGCQYKVHYIRRRAELNTRLEWEFIQKMYELEPEIMKKELPISEELKMYRYTTESIV